ncbi:hypothetical protein [Runella zeae]|uniref:hypothetical protein n=1 Tax=Runella zeae TaxID=94255 RepID=UPI000406D184|nr:hypothetical protein [Runella zeae]
MMADTLLFLMSPAKGHLNATFGLARSAVQQGDRVVYGLPSELHPYVSVVGFECVRLESFPFALNGEQILDKYTTQSRIKYLDNLLDRFYDKFYENRQKTFISILEQIKPTIIFLDSFQSTDFIILYPELKRRKIRFAFIQTMLSLYPQSDNLYNTQYPLFPKFYFCCFFFFGLNTHKQAAHKNFIFYLFYSILNKHQSFLYLYLLTLIDVGARDVKSPRLPKCVKGRLKLKPL